MLLQINLGIPCGLQPGFPSGARLAVENVENRQRFKRLP